MPNHVINEVIFDRPASDHKWILEAACNSDGKVDFAVLIPHPINVWMGSSGSAHEVAFRPENIGLNWARSNWGTKWNAYDHRPIEYDAESLTLRFKTAWATPYPWLVAMFNTVGSFRYSYLDEGASRGRTGSFQTDGGIMGDQWRETDADDALHRHLHKLLWGVEEFTDEDA